MGYSTRTEATAVVAGEVDRLSLNLSIAPPTPTNPPVDTGVLLEYAVGVVVVVLIALVALAYWRRRLPPLESAGRPPGSEALYGDPELPERPLPELPDGSQRPPEGPGGPGGGSDPLG